MGAFVCLYRFALPLLENCKQFSLVFTLKLILSFPEEFGVMANLNEIINAVRKWQGGGFFFFFCNSFKSTFEILVVGYFKPNELLKA